MKYIDVSQFQGVIEWDKLKGSIDGVIIRAGYGQHTIDPQWVRNVTECNRLGIPCGAYWFSYAYTVEMAKREAAAFLAAVKPYTLELPLAFDYEEASVTTAKNNGVTPTASLVQAMTNAFCQTVESAGYWCMVYTNPSFITQYLGSLAGGRYDLWLAQWPKNPDPKNPPRKCGIWQWGCSYPAGIKTTATYDGKVDTNEAYRDYATFLRENGFNRLPPVVAVPTSEPQPDPEPDPAPWYDGAMKWTASQGIMEYTRPEDGLTRAELAQILYNLKHRGDGV